MFSKVVRALSVGAAMGSMLLAVQGATATTFTFNTTSLTTGAVTKTTTGTSTLTSKGDSATYNATTGSQALNMKVSAWQADQYGSYDYYTISSATLGLFSPGLGVLADGESYAGAEHQIDNVGGIDFLLLQFDQSVALSGIGRAVFKLDNITPSDSDASYKAASAGVLAAATNWNSNIDMTNFYITSAGWTTIPGGSSDNSATFESAGSSKIWLVGADILGDRKDGFKLSSITVNTAAVPEPASWAMMIVGFGAVGGTMRRTRRSAALTA